MSKSDTIGQIDCPDASGFTDYAIHARLLMRLQVDKNMRRLADDNSDAILWTKSFVSLGCVPKGPIHNNPVLE